MKAKIILKWIGISVGAIVGLALLGVATVYLMIGRDLSRTFDVALTEISVPATSPVRQKDSGLRDYVAA